MTKMDGGPVLQEHQPLRDYNTFAVPATARYFVAIDKKDDLTALFSPDFGLPHPVLVLGGGSNMLFTSDYMGVVLKINIGGITEQTDGDTVLVESGAGVPWNSLVMYCVDRSYGGVENLSLIPGSVGAAPIQNIGAYGVELQDVFDSLEAFDMQTGYFRRFDREECEFGYRDSVFKRRYRGRFIVTSIRLRLSKTFHPNSSYGAIEAALRERNIHQPGIRDISEVVSAIRVAKLPDPDTIGNAGSFFKNPVVSEAAFESLRKKFPGVVNFSMPTGGVKLAAGWLIEQCGWKGKVVGNTGTWKNQALVLVNHGNASGKEVYDLSERIIASVHDKFNVMLEREVNII